MGLLLKGETLPAPCLFPCSETDTPFFMQQGDFFLFEQGDFCNLPYHRSRIGLYLCSPGDSIITHYRANEQNMSISRLCTAFVHLSRSNRAFPGRTFSAIVSKCKCMIELCRHAPVIIVCKWFSVSRNCGYSSSLGLETLTLKTCFDSFAEPGGCKVAVHSTKDL